VCGKAWRVGSRRGGKGGDISARACLGRASRAVYKDLWCKMHISRIPTLEEEPFEELEWLFVPYTTSQFRHCHIHGQASIRSRHVASRVRVFPTCMQAVMQVPTSPSRNDEGSGLKST